MRVNQVVLIPDFDNQGNLGRHFGRFSEYDALYSYFDSFCEFLDEDRISFRIQAKGDLILPNTLVVHCSSGWEKDDKPRPNSSSVIYATAQSRVIAQLFIETLSEWGRVYTALDHRIREVKNCKDNPLLNIENTMALQIEPFRLNGALADDYIKRGEVLGRMLAQCVYEYMLDRGEVAKIANISRVV